MLDKIDLRLIRVLHAVLTEANVSRAALRLGMQQPAVSAMLKRLRKLANDPILVRSGLGMVPTVEGLRMIEPAAAILRNVGLLFPEVRHFNPLSSEHVFRIATSDFLDPLFLPQLVTHLKALAPACRIEICPLSADSDYHQHLAQGQVDLVIGNWKKPPEDLHLGRLFEDEVVSLVSKQHPAARRGWDVKDWLAAEHIAPMPMHFGARGVIDEHLSSQGLKRNITVRCPHFGLIPTMVASSLLVLTTGRQYCEHYTGTLPVQVLACPVSFPRMTYYQLWHECSHASNPARWLREQTKIVASALCGISGKKTADTTPAAASSTPGAEA